MKILSKKLNMLMKLDMSIGKPENYKRYWIIKNGENFKMLLTRK